MCALFARSEGFFESCGSPFSFSLPFPFEKPRRIPGKVSLFLLYRFSVSSLRRISEERDVSSPFSIIFRLSFVPFLSSPPLHRKLRFCAFMAARFQELQVVASRCARAPAPLIAPSPQLPPTWNATTRSLTRPTPSLSPSLIFTRDEHSCIRDSLIHHSLLLSFVYGRGRRDWLITLERN